MAGAAGLVGRGGRRGATISHICQYPGTQCVRFISPGHAHDEQHEYAISFPQVENLDDRMLYIDDILEFEHAAAEQMRDMMRLRKSRNPREAAKDEVDHALKAFYEELKGSLFTQLLSDCKKYRRVLHKLRPELDRNIQLKTEAARVDLECLNIQPDGEGLASHKSSPSRVRSPIAHDSLLRLGVH